MKPFRTKAQSEADDIGVDVYRLLCRVTRLMDEPAERPNRARWMDARAYLLRTRTAVRQLMHPDDRAVTQGAE